MGNCYSADETPPSPPQKKNSSRSNVHSNSDHKNTDCVKKPAGKPNALSASSPVKPKKIASELDSAANLLATPKDVEDFRHQVGSSNVNIFTYSELRLATKNFRPDLTLGEGGFGVVYKGVIDENVRPGFECTQVAVKELNPEGFQGDREWLAEVNYLGQFSHPNLVRLIGFCCEDVHRLLVYEYMACGSLEKHLFRRVCLTMPWSTRMKIALGAAKGLAFLHGAERPIIYRDFKTSNILLDSDYNAKLSDFGLAKEGPIGDQTHVSTRVMGTYGYAAPEYVMTGHLTARSDVYGFGVVLLEMLIGRRAMDKSRPSREHNLVEWARPLLVHGRKLPKIIDPRMEGQYSTKTAQKVAALAYQCLSQNPKGRPTMDQVVEILESIQDPPESRGDLSLSSGGGGSGVVTLFEIPRDGSGGGGVERCCSSKTEGEREPPAAKVQSHSRRRRTKPAAADGRSTSRSEPPLEYQRYSPSPDSDDTPGGKKKKITSTDARIGDDNDDDNTERKKITSTDVRRIEDDDNGEKIKSTNARVVGSEMEKPGSAGEFKCA